MPRRLAPALALTAALLAPRGAAAATERYALSMFHFNVQYVAGGLVGFLDSPGAEAGHDAERVEDDIVVESFQPVLEMLAAHPTWGADLELQGYMLDVMGERHPDVLDLLRQLATTGQVEVVSFHYSDQLFMAYPKEDWRRSEKLDREAFERWGVPRGQAVFCQEGQAGPGMADAMAEAGYRTLVFPKNLFAYQHGDDPPPAPLYRFGQGRMLTSRGLSFQAGADSIDTTWWFVDDGELYATGGIDPYITEEFARDPAAMADHEAELAALEDSGYQLTTVSKYVDALEGRVPLTDPPPLLDGTWQPSSTDGIHRWLGGFGVWWKDERDGDVRTLGALAHRELLAAEAAAAAAGVDASDDIAGAFRLLSLGQVTDASGINPFRGEVEYGIAHQTEALRIARDVLSRAKAALGTGTLAVDTASGSVTPGEARPAAPPAVATGPLALDVHGGDRAVTTTWRQVDTGHYLVELHFGAGDERALSVTFPGALGDLVYTPGLADAPVHVPRDAFVFDHYELALSDGLIGLGADTWVVLDQARVHASATITRDDGAVVVHDETAPAGEVVTWVFHVLTGSEDAAAAAALALNVTPKVWR